MLLVNNCSKYTDWLPPGSACGREGSLPEADPGCHGHSPLVDFKASQGKKADPRICVWREGSLPCKQILGAMASPLTVCFKACCGRKVAPRICVWEGGFSLPQADPGFHGFSPKMHFKTCHRRKAAPRICVQGKGSPPYKQILGFMASPSRERLCSGGRGAFARGPLHQEPHCPQTGLLNAKDHKCIWSSNLITEM